VKTQRKWIVDRGICTSCACFEFITAKQQQAPFLSRALHDKWRAERLVCVIHLLRYRGRLPLAVCYPVESLPPARRCRQLGRGLPTDADQPTLLADVCAIGMTAHGRPRPPRLLAIGHVF
jgi:hypothetical protein